MGVTAAVAAWTEARRVARRGRGAGARREPTRARRSPRRASCRARSTGRRARRIWRGSTAAALGFDDEPDEVFRVSRCRAESRGAVRSTRGRPRPVQHRDEPAGAGRRWSPRWPADRSAGPHLGVGPERRPGEPEGVDVADRLQLRARRAGRRSRRRARSRSIRSGRRRTGSSSAEVNVSSCPSTTGMKTPVAPTSAPASMLAVSRADAVPGVHHVTRSSVADLRGEITRASWSSNSGTPSAAPSRSIPMIRVIAVYRPSTSPSKRKGMPSMSS